MASKANNNNNTQEKNMPSKGQLITGLVVFAIGMYAYNKIGMVRKALGGA